MSELIIGHQIWLQMTELEKIEVVRNGRATLRQLTQGLLDGPDELRDLCRDFLAHTGTGLQELPVDLFLATSAKRNFHDSSANGNWHSPPIESSLPRSGLPQGFVLGPNRYRRRTRLLKDNIYRLPDKREFVPAVPSGALGRVGHLYALLTEHQYQQSQRGSIYIRNDGRIFDYSGDSSATADELFDTGFTMDDLRRTGRYASRLEETSHSWKTGKRTKMRSSDP